MFSAGVLIAALTLLGWIGLKRFGTELGLLERLALSYGIGAGVFTFTTFLAAWFGIQISTVSGIVIYGALLAAAGLISRAAPGNSSRLSLRWVWPTAIEFALLAGIAIIVLIVWLVARFWPVYAWDALTAWEFKGRIIARDGSLAELGLTDATSYPLNLSLQIAYLYLLGSDFAQAIFPVYFVALIVLLYSRLALASSKSVALFCALLFAATPVVASHSTIAYANAPFAFYYSASAIYLLEFLSARNQFYLFLSGALLGLGAWTRQDAVLYFFINLGVLIAFSWRFDWLKRLSLYTISFALLWLPWNIYWRISGFQDFLGTGIKSLSAALTGHFHFERIPEILSYASEHALLFSEWGLLWLALPFALALGWRSIRARAPLIALISLNFIGLVATYYVAADDTSITLNRWLSLGYDRLALHWTALIPLLLGLTMKDAKVFDHLTILRRSLDPYLILLLLFSLFAIGPLLGPGYFWSAHDGRHSVYFLFEFDRAIQDGIWYPRWAPDFTFGFGYPFFNIYAPGAFYVGELLHLLGFDFVTATKIVFALAIILSGPAMFAFVKRLTNSSPAAFLSGLVYVYVPYHIVDIYVRAALAELVALIFLPLTLLGFYTAVMHPSRKALVAAALAYGAMHFTHNGVALLFTPVLIAWILFLLIGKLREKHQPFFTRQMLSDGIRLAVTPFLGALLGVGLAAIFVLPAVLEYSYVRTDQWLSNYYDYTNHFAYLFQLFSPFWDFGISVAGPQDQMSFQLGVVPVLLAIFAVYSIFKYPNGMRRYWLFFLTLTLLTMGLMLSWSLPLWETLRLVTFAQFPWRLLTLTNVSLAILAGAIALHHSASESPNRSITPSPNSLSLPILLLGLLIVLGSFPYLSAQTTLQAAEGPVSILGLLKFQQSAGEMTGVSAWVEEIPTWSPMADVYFANRRVKSKIEFSEFNPDILWFGVDQDGKGIRSNGETVEFDAQDANQTVTWNIDYYPGWHVYLAEKIGKDLKITRELPITIQGEHARIQVSIPQGRHWLMLKFEDTAPRVAGTWISAASILIILGLLGIKRERAF